MILGVPVKEPDLQGKPITGWCISFNSSRSIVHDSRQSRGPGFTRCGLGKNIPSVPHDHFISWYGRSGVLFFLHDSYSLQDLMKNDLFSYPGQNYSSFNHSFSRYYAIRIPENRYIAFLWAFLSVIGLPHVKNEKNPCFGSQVFAVFAVFPEFFWFSSFQWQ
jgi:hypothetical protein